VSAIPSCDIIIPVYNKPDITFGCLKSIAARTDGPFRLILIDNGSDEMTKRLLAEYKAAHGNVELIRNEENLGWVKAVNQGMARSAAPYICIMNNDTVVETDGWLSRMIAIAESAKDIGLVNPDFGGIEQGPCRSGEYIEIDFCRGYCVLIKRSVIDRIGLLDEEYGPGYYDDDDYSVRAIRSGFRCLRAVSVTVRHLRDSTFSTVFADEKRRELHQRNKELFYRKWGRRLRIVFILRRGATPEKARDAMLDLARRQHIVYLWNWAPKLGVEHINVRERSGWRPFPGISVVLALGLNLMKRSSKRYDAVFTDDVSMAERLGRILGGRIPAYSFDIGDRRRIVEIVDQIAKA
jgi:GT2 family glycosyltransferase